MSFLQKLMGGTFESNLEEAEGLLAAERFGEAKLAFDRALKKGKGQPPDALERIREKVLSCKLALARAHIGAADEALADDDVETAREELEVAREICDEPEIVDALAERLGKCEAITARLLAEDGDEISDDELMMVIAGTWSEAQAEEYAAYPDELRGALLAGHDGDHETALGMLEELVDRPEIQVEKKYIWLEVGKQRLALGDDEAALESLGRFTRLADDWGDEEPDPMIAALGLEANALVALERFEEAEERLVKITELAPDDHGTFLALGNFRRRREDYKGALRALEHARELMGQAQPDIRVIREIGLTQLEMGDEQGATASLGSVIEHHASKGQHDQFDPETAVTLAGLYEKQQDSRRAADIYRHLAVGYDVPHHFDYNLQAARLLAAAGEERALVESYLGRAEELIREDSQRVRFTELREKLA